MSSIPEKQYISRKTLRDCGLTIKDEIIFCQFLNKVNQQIAQAVEKELHTEIAVNHSKETLDKYSRLLSSDGFNSKITQDWLTQNIPALFQIEREWQEIILNRIAKNA